MRMTRKPKLKLYIYKCRKCGAYIMDSLQQAPNRKDADRLMGSTLMSHDLKMHGSDQEICSAELLCLVPKK